MLMFLLILVLVCVQQMENTLLSVILLLTASESPPCLMCSSVTFHLTMIQIRISPHCSVIALKVQSTLPPSVCSWDYPALS